MRNRLRHLGRKQLFLLRTMGFGLQKRWSKFELWGLLFSKSDRTFRYPASYVDPIIRQLEKRKLIKFIKFEGYKTTIRKNGKESNELWAKSL